jgi:hypothetical protein
MKRMRNAIAVTAAFVAAAAVVPAATPARPQTTTPGVIYTLKTPVDDKGIHMPKDQFTKNGITRYPRGGEIQYVFTNKGTKPYAVRIWGHTTPVIKPGGHATVFINWQYRGTYKYWRIYRGHRISPVGTIVIF